MSIAASAPIATLVTATWNSGPNAGTVAARLTNWDRSLSDGANVFTAVLMGLRFTDQSGTMDDAPVHVDLPDTVYPFATLAAGVPLAQLRVDIQRCAPDNAGGISGGSTYTEWAGLVGKATHRPEGIAGVVRVRVDGVKSFFSIPLGIMTGTRCQHARFGGVGCDVDRSALTYDGVIEEVNPDGVPGRLSVSFDAATPALTDLSWRNGDITTADGGVLQIRASAGAPSGDGDAMFDVNSVVLPASWEGTACVIREGCDRTLERCTALGNTSRHLAIGRAMPTRNPIYDKTA